MRNILAGRVRGLLATLAILGVADAAHAAERTLYVRSTQAGCDALSLPDPGDCGTLVGAALVIIYGEQSVSPTSRFLVDIGPGDFTFPIISVIHDVTFRGAGPATTRLTTSYFGLGVDNLHFQDLAIVGAGVDYRTGSSTWTNVSLSGSRYGFLGRCFGATNVTHRFFASTIESRAENASHNAAIYSRCGAVSVYGSDVRVVGNALPGEPTATTIVGAEATGTTSVEIYGSSVRVPATGPLDPSFNVEVTGNHEPGSGQPEGIFGIRVGALVAGGAPAGGGEVRMHGGIVNTNGGADIEHPAAVTAVLGVAGAKADLSDTAFFVRAGGTAYRLRNTATPNVRSPFLWEPTQIGPPHGNPRSVDGADLYVQTGCLCSGLCDGSGTETHLMIYNAAACGVGGWFDTSTRRCRNDVDTSCLE